MYSGMQPKVAKVKPNQVIKLHTTSWWNRKPDKYSWIISPQIAFPEKEIINPSFGLMVARVKEFGLYGKFNYSPQVNHSEDNDYYFTDKRKSSYTAVTGGLIYRLRCPVHLYIGAGYVDHQVSVQLTNGAYRLDKSYASYDGIAFEAGLLLRYGRYSLNGGLLFGAPKYHKYIAANFGVGFSF